MAQPSMRLLPLSRAPRLRLSAFSFVTATGGFLSCSGPSSTAAAPLSPNSCPAAPPLSVASRTDFNAKAQPRKPASAAGLRSLFSGKGSFGSVGIHARSSRPSVDPSIRRSLSRAMSGAPPFTPAARPVDAANGIERVLSFWFGDWAPTASKASVVSDEERMQKLPIWFMKSEALDIEIKDAFAALLEEGKAGKLGVWEDSPLGAAALIILLDQFSRNIYRGSPESFSADPQALVIAERTIDLGFDKKVPGPIRNFIYLPFMHSEDLAKSTYGIKMYEEFLKELPEGAVKKYTESTLKFSILHTDVIKKFGRFPHRSVILGRESTPEEIEYVKQGGGF